MQAAYLTAATAFPRFPRQHRAILRVLSRAQQDAEKKQNFVRRGFNSDISDGVEGKQASVHRGEPRNAFDRIAGVSDGI